MGRPYGPRPDRAGSWTGPPRGRSMAPRPRPSAKIARAFRVPPRSAGVSRRFWIGVAVFIVLATIAVGAQMTLDRAATRALAAPLLARERHEQADRAGPRGRPPRIEPDAGGDAMTVYDAIAT